MSGCSLAPKLIIMTTHIFDTQYAEHAYATHNSRMFALFSQVVLCFVIEEKIMIALAVKHS